MVVGAARVLVVEHKDLLVSIEDTQPWQPPPSQPVYRALVSRSLVPRLSSYSPTLVASMLLLSLLLTTSVAVDGTAVSTAAVVVSCALTPAVLRNVSTDRSARSSSVVRGDEEEELIAVLVVNLGVVDVDETRETIMATARIWARDTEDEDEGSARSSFALEINETR